jgi:hypothetical protein
MRKQARLFREQKRSKKNFDDLEVAATPEPHPPFSKSFLLLFFKKEGLTSLRCLP